MKKFRVPFTVTVTVYVVVEAEKIDEAIDNAYDKVHLSQYVGNGGSDKIIGVHASNLSVEAGENFEVIEDSIEELTPKHK